MPKLVDVVLLVIGVTLVIGYFAYGISMLISGLCCIALAGTLATNRLFTIPPEYLRQERNTADGG